MSNCLGNYLKPASTARPPQFSSKPISQKLLQFYTALPTELSAATKRQNQPRGLILLWTEGSFMAVIHQRDIGNNQDTSGLRALMAVKNFSFLSPPKSICLHVQACSCCEDQEWLTVAMGPSSMLQDVQGFQFCCGGDQGTTPPGTGCDTTSSSSRCLGTFSENASVRLLGCRCPQVKIPTSCHTNTGQGVPPLWHYSQIL